MIFARSFLLLIALIISIVWFFNVPLEKASFILYKTNTDELNIIPVQDLVPFDQRLVLNVTDVKVLKSEDLTNHLNDIENEKLVIIINTDSYKPSSPKPDFLFGRKISIPMVLVRKENEEDINSLIKKSSFLEVAKVIDFGKHHDLYGDKNSPCKLT